MGLHARLTVEMAAGLIGCRAGHQLHSPHNKAVLTLAQGTFHLL